MSEFRGNAPQRQEKIAFGNLIAGQQNLLGT